MDLFERYITQPIHPSMKKIILILALLIGGAVSLLAPNSYVLTIESIKPINSYDALIRAVVAVESKGDNFAYNPKEQAVGAFQIRPIRLKHFNELTGKDYKLTDLYDYDISLEIFMFFARMKGYNFELIAKSWNGSGPMTEIYWNKVKSKL